MNIIFAAYLNHKPDPQRNITWGNPEELYDLAKSVSRNGENLEIFYNNLTGMKHFPGVKYMIKSDLSSYVPNVARWFIYYEELKSRPEIDFLWMVDSTDVVLLHSPFQHMEDDVLYVGEEWAQKVDNLWMRTRQEPFIIFDDYRQIIEKNANKTLPNCGLIGGSRKMILAYLEYATKYHQKTSINLNNSTDMAVFNYTIWKHFPEVLEQGPHINTKFKKYEYTNAWWKHK